MRQSTCWEGRRAAATLLPPSTRYEGLLVARPYIWCKPKPTNISADSCPFEAFGGTSSWKSSAGIALLRGDREDTPYSFECYVTWTAYYV